MSCGQNVACLLTTPDVSSSDEELDNRNSNKQFVELDSLDTEKALMLTDDDDPLWVRQQHLLCLNYTLSKPRLKTD